MMKRLVFAALVLLFAALAFPALAQTGRMMIAPAPDTGSAQLFGQEHHYTVTFRGNGEAIVLMKAIFSNNSDTPLSSMRLQIPRVEPDNLVVYQVIKDPVCVQYGVASCVQYRDPQYSDFLYGDARFQEVKVVSKEGAIELQLPTPVKADQAGAVLVHFRSKGYISHTTFGASDYVFESIKVQDSINNLIIGISTDADQVLKGGQGNVQYETVGDTSLKAAEAVVARGGAQLNNYFNMIGQGDVVKQVTNLDAGESYTVRGSYADSVLKLYGQDIVTGLVLVAALLAVLVGVVRALVRRSDPKDSIKSRNSARLATFTIVGSFVLSLIVLGKTIGFIYLTNQLAQYAYSGVMYSLGMMLMMVVAVFVYVLVVVVPAIIFGYKKGLWWGVGLFVATIMWLGLYLVAFMVYLLVTKPQVPQYPPIMPMQGGVMMEKEVSE